MKKRYINIGDIPPKHKDANGRWLCCWCEKPCPPRRSRWCSEECSREYAVRANPSYARWKVEERDHGICAICGIDTGTISEMLDYLRSSSHKAFRDESHHWHWRSEYCKWLVGVLGIQVGCNYHLWEMDHIIPVSEGGGACGLDNLRTLCIACHRDDTANLARRRADERNPQGRLPLRSRK